MKIGDKTYKPKITNQVIFDIEEHFDKDIMQLINTAEELRTKDMAYYIYYSVRDEFADFDTFIDSIKLNQYVECAIESTQEIIKAFGLDKASKKK